MNLLYALALGPFNFFRLSVREGIIAIIIPPCLFASIIYLLFEGSFKEAAGYKTEFAIWGGLYWMLCIVASLIGSYEQKQKERKKPVEVQVNDSIKHWLQQNPGKTLNDYFSKFPV